MKISIAVDGKNINSQISEIGGRAPYYLIFENGMLLETIKNPFATGSGGAGFSVAHMLAEKGVSVVIAGEIGVNMKSALQDKNIKFIKADTSKNADEVIREYK